MKQNALRTALKITRSTLLAGTLSFNAYAQDKNPNWNELGTYFNPLTSIDSAQSENWSKQRFERLKSRFATVQNRFQVNDAPKECITAFEGGYYKPLSLQAMDAYGLSNEQQIMSVIMRLMDQTQQGRPIIYAAEFYDLILCLSGKIQSVAGYNSFVNAAIVNPKETKTDKISSSFSTSRETDLTNNAFQNLPNLGFILYSFAEEMTHSYQSKNSRITSSPRQTPYSRPDEKLWNLLVESHAKVIASLILVEIASKNNNAYLKLLDKFTDPENKDGTAQTIRKVLDIITVQGIEKIRNNPTLLLPAYMTFIQNTGDTYLPQACNFINNIDPANTDRITIDQIIQAFGQIPKMEGNALQEAFHGKTPEDIVELMSDNSDLKIWFQEGYAAMEKGQDVPPLATDVPGCAPGAN